MSDDSADKQRLLQQVADTQEHFADLMNERLSEVGQRELALYLTILSKLVLKLEQPGKTLRDIAQEMFAEVATLVMAEMGR
ncbi:MAG: hypothetical protein HY899_05510 [Deltaproteobacteria bacterium]|nr:hypothetical protein [Deltaproteobacteria bacterium]